MRTIPLQYLSAIRITNGLGLPGAHNDPTWPRYVRTTDIAGPRSLRSDTFASQPPEVAAAALLQTGDILMTAAGATIGKSTTFLGDYAACYAGFLVRYRPARGVDGRFIAYWMQSKHYWGQIESGAVRSTIDNFSAGKYRKLEVPATDLHLQLRIADYLDGETAQIDTLIAKQEQLIATLRERRQASSAEVVWNGLRAPHADRHSGSPWQSAPPHWRRLRNKYLLEERGILSSDGQETMLSVSHLTGVTTRAEKAVTMFEAESNIGYRNVQPGNLVINTMWAWMGALGTSKLTGIVSPAYGVYQSLPGAEFDPDFFDAAYRSPAYVDLMTVHSTGIWSSRLRLYPDVFLSLPIVVPPIAEQHEIAAEIRAQTSKIDTLISKAEQFIALAKERRSALITAAVTGQIDVTGKAA